jgi:hypothetical protein
MVSKMVALKVDSTECMKAVTMGKHLVESKVVQLVESMGMMMAAQLAIERVAQLASWWVD